MASRKQLFNAQFITREVSRVMASSNALLSLFGMNPGGRNIGDSRTRTGAYDVYNQSRKTLPNTAPGSSSPTRRRTKVGSVAYTVAQFKSKTPLLHDELHNYRAIGANTTEVDSRGMALIRRERDQIALEAANTRAAMVAGMLRGQLYVSPPDQQQTSYIDWDTISNGFTQDFKIPAGNKGQLDMLGDGAIIDASWATATTDIPSHLRQVNAAFQEVWGGRLEMMIGNYTLFDYLVKNDFIQEAAGTSNSPYTVYVRGDQIDPRNAMPNIAFEARFQAFPWLRVLIMDEGLELGAPGSETFKKFIPDDHVWLGPDPERQTASGLWEMLEYAEPTSEGPNLPPALRKGIHAYGVDGYDPARTDLHIQDNAIPSLYVPAATAWAKVANFGG